MALALAGVGSAEAQAKPAASHTPTVATSVVGAEALASPVKATEDDGEAENENPMKWFGIGAKVGLAGMGGSKMSLEAEGQSIDSELNSRAGLLVSMPLNMGGDGVGFVFEPMLQMSSVNQPIPGQTDGAVAGYNDVSMLGVGGYLGPTFNFHVKRHTPLYLGFGFGLKALYQLSDAFEYAGDLQARLPITGTYYVSKKLALVAEMGFGYGASVYTNKPQQRELGAGDVVVDPNSGQASVNAAELVKFDPLFGTAFVWDAALGIRLP